MPGRSESRGKKLCTFVSSLFELLVLGGLINEFQYLICERTRCKKASMASREKKYLVIQLG